MSDGAKQVTTYTIIRHHSGRGWTFRNERNPRHTKEHVPRPSAIAVMLYLIDHQVPWQNIVWPHWTHGSTGERPTLKSGGL